MNRYKRRQNRSRRVKAKIKPGLVNMPKAIVFKSLRHIEIQIVDVNAQKTICGATSKDKTCQKKPLKDCIDNIAGNIADCLAKNKIKNVVFDRNGYKYHGHVKSLAESLRSKGIKL